MVVPKQKRSRAGALQVILSPEERGEVLRRARACRLTLTEYVRRVALSPVPPARLSAEHVRALTVASGALLRLAARFDALIAKPGPGQDRETKVKIRALVYESRGAAARLDRVARTLSRNEG